MTARTQGGRRPRRARRPRTSQRLTFGLASFSRLHYFIVLLGLWLKHSFFDRISRSKELNRRLRTHQRERIFVDASFHSSDRDGGPGIGGIGIWVPRRGIAIALKVDARSSMEAEILALLAGTLAAKRLGVERPVIFSDCKSAVQTAVHHMTLGRTKGFLAKLLRAAELSHEHHAFAQMFDSLHSLGGSVEWQPRENNREADLASSIGSRHGHMGIMLSGAKDRNHALNDVLSATADDSDSSTRKFRSGTRTVRPLSKRGMASSRRFAREAKKLIAQISAEVADVA